MKTIILILSALIIILSSCKKEVRTDIQVKSKKRVLPMYIIDDTKPAGSLRVIVKPLCYEDINLAYLRSKEGC